MMSLVHHAALAGLFALKHTLPGLRDEVALLGGRYDTKDQAEETLEFLLSGDGLLAGESIEIVEVEEED